MRANAKDNEASWLFNDFYQWQRKKNNGPSFIIHDGPPYANGSLHIGHALNKVLKDIMLRYKAMRGFKVHFIPGWDCHGLPIELKALENLKKKGGEEMLKAKNPIMIRELAKECALEQIEIQKAQFRSWGVMGDWDKHYKTMDATYEARQIEIFYDMFKKGLIYRGLKPVYWSPSSVTALAEAELEYNDEHVSLSVYVKIKTTADSIGALHFPNLHFLIWTTTPWTLPSNKAIAISRNLEYCIVKCEGSHLIVGKDRVAPVMDVLNKGPFEIVATLPGSDLTVLEYHPPFANEVYPVFHGAHVTAESGTGIVHTAPSHGMDDYNVCLENGLMEFLAPVDDYGKFTAGAGERLTGKAVLGDGNLEVVKMLEETGALLAKANFTHKYPYDWRTKKPIIVRATWQWFCGLKKIRDKSIHALNKVNFFPKSAQSRLVSMVQSRNDWCISRQRSWGMPVPVFYKISNGEPLVDVLTISHIRSIFARYGSDCWWTMTMLELMPPAYKHRYQEYRIGQDTLDVWFDSGCSWYSVVEGSGVGQADMYLEGSDQHRGWFQSSLLTSVAFHRRAPYRNLVTHGFVLDEHGRKMSKSLGNVIDMDALIKGGTINKKAFEGYGVDAFRFWVASTNYTSDITIAPSNIEDAAMHIRKLRNTARFLLGNLAEFDQDVPLNFDDLLDIDKYMLNQLYHFAETITEGYETIAFAKVVQSLLVFANVDLSAFYFDVTKDRLYTSPKHSQARRSARFVMNQILRVLMQAMAPILCHMTENVYQHTGTYNAEDLDLKSIFQLGWFRTDDKWKSKEREARWTQWRQLKHDFHVKVDELVRVESSVKKTTDVDLVIQTSRDSDFYRTCVAPYNSEELAGVLEIFIASRCLVQVTDDAAHASPVLVVTAAQGQKCPRCWKKVRREDNLFCDKELCPT